MMGEQSDTGKRPEMELETYFAAARDTAPVPDAALLGRVLMDAGRVRLPWHRRLVRRWREMRAAMGGAPAMAALGCALVVGLWLGVARPDGVALIAANVVGGDDAAVMVDVMAGDAFASLEGAF
ncbi:hypothetical protein [Roseovarius sp. E0-M6]|uniref:hypothetical protein n=1 Tax=Roseovarius sp. E0-M6 TaxID=3127118 RepID=UPI003010326E